MMHKQWAWGSIFIWLALTVTGCAAVKVYSSSPAVQRLSNDYFNVELEPQLQEGQNFFTSFRFVFTNKTKKDLHVDWENTFYLFNGRRSGRFLWEGVDWEALKKIRNQPLVPVAAGDTVTAVIFPKSLAGRSKIGTTTDRRHTRGPLPAGENGLFLVVRQNGREIREKIVVKIEAQQNARSHSPGSCLTVDKYTKMGVNQKTSWTHQFTIPTIISDSRVFGNPWR